MGFKMNNEKQQEEILKEVKECSSKYGDDNIETERYYKWMDKVWGKAKQHKEKVLEGCGENYSDEVSKPIFICCEGSLCPDCQKIIDKYKEVGI